MLSLLLIVISVLSYVIAVVNVIGCAWGRLYLVIGCARLRWGGRDRISHRCLTPVTPTGEEEEEGGDAWNFFPWNTTAATWLM